MTGRLTALVAELIRPAPGSPGLGRLDAVRAHLAADLTVVVTGRRGVGKTRLINALVGSAVAEPGLTAHPRPVALVTARPEDAPAWVEATEIPAPFRQGRRFVEVPDQSADVAAATITQVAELRPDLVVHVARQPLRTDELELLEAAQEAWRLEPVDVVVVVDPDEAEPSGRQRLRRRVLAARRRPFTQVVLAGLGDAPEGDRAGAVETALRDAEPLVEARRARLALTALTAPGATQPDDGGWGRSLNDDIERLSLAPAAHAMRERWAIGESLNGRARLSPELRDDAVGLFLPFAVAESRRSDAGTRREELLARTSRWRAEANDLPPVGAEVARVVVQSCRIRLDATPGVNQPDHRLQPAHPTEARHVHA